MYLCQVDPHDLISRAPIDLKGKKLKVKRTNYEI